MMLTAAGHTALDSNISLNSGVVVCSGLVLHSRCQAFESSRIAINTVFSIFVHQEEL